MHNLAPSGAKTLAAFVVVFAGAQVLHAVDGSGWIDSLSSVATVAATGVALYIATRDRSDRKADQLDTDRAQARLVLTEVDGPYRGEKDHPPHFMIQVEANGAQPILDAALESAQYVHDGHALTLVPLPGVVPIIKPERAPGSLGAVLPAGGALTSSLIPGGDVDEHGLYNKPELLADNVIATIQFTDANGNRWRRSTQGAVSLISAPADA